MRFGYAVALATALLLSGCGGEEPLRTGPIAPNVLRSIA
jgi:hypothetical protein